MLRCRRFVTASILDWFRSRDGHSIPEEYGRTLGRRPPTGRGAGNGLYERELHAQYFAGWLLADY